jgi:DNA-3-methyladenine glycosylase II
MENGGTIDEPKLCVTLEGKDDVSTHELKRAAEVASSLFNTKLALNPFYAEVKKDKTFTRLLRKLRGLRSPTTPTVFEALVDSIVEQQISLNVANSIERKLVKTFGDKLMIHDETYFVYPTPQRLAKTSIEQLRKVGLSSRKAEYIKEVSDLVAEGKLDLEQLKRLTDSDKIITELDRIRGIGVWTAELTMIRGMQKWDALPADDLGLKRTISHYYSHDRKISSEETRRIAQMWGRWKGLAAYYLIVSAGIKETA